MYGAAINQKMAQRDNQKLTFQHVLFLMGIFAKQFYLLPSGSLQMGDILMLGSFVWCFFVNRSGRIFIFKEEKVILLYFGAIAIINGAYSLFYKNVGFMKSTIYYLFNIITLLVFMVYIKRADALTFLLGLRKVLQYALLTQSLLYVLGIGQWYGGSRYLGTFNDPNQYGVYIFFSTLLIYMIGCMLKKKNWPWLVLGFLLVLPSSSSGMLIGFFSFAVVHFIIDNYQNNRGKVIFAMVMLCIVVILTMCLWAGYIKMPDYITDMSMYKRFIGKVEEIFSGSSTEALLEDRAWERVFEFPQYILYGAGEGNHARFGTSLEIHSSILGPLFYYGVIPFVLFISWCWGKFKGLDQKFACVYIALFVESFFLVNTRQPTFWMLIALAGAAPAKHKKIKDFTRYERM